jgi:hypothetical protein
MRRSQRRRLFNLFALATLAFALYLIVFYKEDETRQPAATASIHLQIPAH